MNIDEMQAGPELDRAVAEKVMGWQKVIQSEQIVKRGGQIIWRTFGSVGIPPLACINSTRRSVPAWSTQIKSAFQVIERLTKHEIHPWIFKIWYSPDLSVYETAFWRYIDTRTGEPADLREVPYEYSRELGGHHRDAKIESSICFAALKAMQQEGAA